MHQSRSGVLLPVVVSVLGGAIAAACVVVHDDPRARGDLTLIYDFQGLGCGAAGVDSVDFELAGDGGGAASASAGCEPGYFTFVDLPEDNYRVIIDAYDAGDGLLYSGTFRAVVRGNSGIDVIVSLEPASGDLTFYWTFAGSAACLDVVDVHVLLHDPFGAIYDDAFYPCEQAGVTYANVMAGAWHVWLDGLNFADAVLYRADNASLYVDAGVDNAYDIDLGF